MRRVWLAWVVFGVCAGAMLAVMGWGTKRLIRAEEAETRARREAALEENVRLSLWRMETALAGIVVRENSRPYGAYRELAKRKGGADPEYAGRYFEFEAEGAQMVGFGSAESRRTLSATIPRTWIQVERSAAAPPVQQAPVVQQAEAPKQAVQAPVQSQMARNLQEFEARGVLNSRNALVAAPNAGAAQATRAKTVEIRTGVMAPVWLGDELVLARHVQAGAKEMVQGCVLDWRKVRRGLLASIEDLLPGSDLIPERGRFDPAEGRTLTSLPLRLVPGRVAGAAEEERSPLRFSLALGWACVVVAIAAVGALLMGAISLGQRRAAFVSSVTHELRSPLTTFRMYTEMLVEGMAADAAKQKEYYQTLYRESDRLVHLVENVLSYARLERGRYGDRETVAAGPLIERMRGRLAEHARLAEMELAVAVNGDAGNQAVCVDGSAIERILFNLVDNACKYARAAEDRTIHVEVDRVGRRVRIAVRDHGPGLPRTGRLFRPFRKTAKEAAKTAPGVGIGLALSRRLAKAAGGKLVAVDGAGGACLRVELPVARLLAAEGFDGVNGRGLARGKVGGDSGGSGNQGGGREIGDGVEGGDSE